MCRRKFILINGYPILIVLSLLFDRLTPFQGDTAANAVMLESRAGSRKLEREKIAETEFTLAKVQEPNLE